MAKTAKPLPALDWLEPRMQLSRTLSLLSFAVLLLFVLLWNLLFADLHGARTWVVLVIQLTPLAILAPGMLSGKGASMGSGCGMTGRARPAANQPSISPCWAAFVRLVQPITPSGSSLP